VTSYFSAAKVQHLDILFKDHRILASIQYSLYKEPIPWRALLIQCLTYCFQYL